MLMMAALLRLHQWRHQPGRTDHVQQIRVESGVPLLVGDLGDGRTRPVPGAVDEHVDPSPLRHRSVDEALQIVVRLVRAGDADAAELGSQCLALARGRQNRDAKPVRCQPSRSPRPHAAAAGGNESNLLCCHDQSSPC